MVNDIYAHYTVIYIHPYALVSSESHVPMYRQSGLEGPEPGF